MKAIRPNPAGDRSFDQTIDQLALRTLRPILLVVGLYLLVLAVSHAIFTAPPERTVMVTMAAGGGLFLLALLLWLLRHPVAPERSHLIQGLAGILVAANCVAHLGISGDLKQTTNFAIAVIGGGVLFFSLTWYYSLVAVLLASWITIVRLEDLSAELVHYAFVLASATVLSVLTFHIRRRSVEQLHLAREVVRDLERKQAAEEERQRLAHQLQGMDNLRSLGVLAGGIAHDFNNILTAVLGHTELAREEIRENRPVCEHLDQILQSTTRAAELVNQMLVYAGRANVSREKVDLSRIVDETCHLVGAGIGKMVQIRQHLTPGLTVEADPRQLGQLLVNLLTNAAEAFESRPGVIDVTVTHEHFDAHWLKQVRIPAEPCAAGHVTVTVADQGAGMDSATLDRLFEPFFTTKFSGRGLGLSAVLGILQAHGGALDVQSTPGLGSRFTVMLPALEPAIEPIEAADRPRTASPGGTVLVVDDEPVVRRFLEFVVQKQGLTVLTAADGREAVEAAGAHPEAIDLVILDVVMPGMGGLEALREIRKLRPRTQFIVQSGFSEEDMVHQFAGEPVLAFLRKPFRPDQVAAAVHDALAGNPQQRAAGTW